MWERNAADDTFGFGVVFSDETLGGIEHADPAIHAAMEARVRPLGRHRRALPRAQVITSGGHGFAAMSRKRPAARSCRSACAELGVTVHFRTAAPDVDELAGDPRPGGRRRRRSTPRSAPGTPTRSARRWTSAACKYMWLGTDLVFDAFTFYVRETPYGVMQVHGYPYDATASTFIVEMHEDVWRAPGSPTLDDQAVARRASPTRTSIARIRGDLRRRSSTATRSWPTTRSWITFTTVRNERWRARQRRAARRRRPHRALLHRLGHQARHGGRARARRLPARAARRSTRRSTAYEAERRPVVVSTQRAAQASLEWFENIGQYVDQEPAQFAFNIMTRSRRVTYDNLQGARPGVRRRRWTRGSPQHDARRGSARTPRRCSSRSGSASWSWTTGSSSRRWTCTRADDGMPNDFHLVHLGGKALGGAGLVMTEMVCVSAEGRITPGCTGHLDRRAGARRGAGSPTSCTAESPRKIGIQLGHSGRKGSTKLMWEGMDEPLDRGQLGGRRAVAAALPARASTRCRAS